MIEHKVVYNRRKRDCLLKSVIKTTREKWSNVRVIRPLGERKESDQRRPVVSHTHYSDVIMSALASQITSLAIVYSTVYSGTDQRKHQSPASLAFVRGIHRGPVNSPHKWPVTRKMCPFGDVIMKEPIMHQVCPYHGVFVRNALQCIFCQRKIYWGYYVRTIHTVKNRRWAPQVAIMSGVLWWCGPYD